MFIIEYSWGDIVINRRELKDSLNSVDINFELGAKDSGIIEASGKHIDFANIAIPYKHLDCIKIKILGEDKWQKT